jgi:putative endopeptidase
MQKFLYLFFVIVLATSCSTNSSTKDVLAANMDTSVNPADDFFAFANGGWIKANPIPGEESSWSIGNMVVNENLNRLKIINEKAAVTKAEAGSPEQKIGDFWKTAMDSAAIEKAGLNALQPYFDKINAISDRTSLFTTMGEIDKVTFDGMLAGLFITQDEKNSAAMAIYWWQSGLNLPEKEFYFKTDAEAIKIREAYVKYVTHMLTMSGVKATEATSSATAMLRMETELAKSHRSMEALRDPNANYNKMSAAAAFKLAPNFDFQTYFSTLGIPIQDNYIVGQPGYYQALDKIIQSTPLNILKLKMRFELLNNFAGQLPDAYGKASFEYNKLFSGAKERKPRWKRVLNAEENVMGELLGKLFAKEYFNETAKQRYEKMVEAVKAALKTRIENLAWMSDSTKQKALKKLATMKQKVGYPDKWKDFSTLDIKADSYIENVMRANKWWYNYSINKLGKPVDRDEWNMYPQTYNAYYNPSNNEIVLPAGIFTVPGYRDEELDDAVVYGYGGASTIGHEITHGFDDQGRQYDDQGNLTNWWSKEDEAKFNARAAVMVKQFSNYVVIDTFKINGKATLGENIADLGGVLLGLDAFKQTAQYKKDEKISGLTPVQRYFMGYALGWLGHSRQEQLRTQVLTDVHSPAKFRVNGPFVSVADFYTAFDVKSGSKMYLADSARVSIW